MEERFVHAIRTFTNELITKTAQSLNVSTEIAFLLLDHFHWNQEELNSKWESSQDEILKSLHINLGGAYVPTLESDLVAVDAGTGKCPKCSRERKRLSQLYCGHKICNDCLKEHITKSLNDNQKIVCYHDGCCAEIVPKTAEKMLPHDSQAKVYKYWRTNVSFENAHYKVAICPNPLCKNLIVRGDNLPNDLVRCPNCDFALCLKCLSDAHAPLYNCERATEFTETLPKKFNKLLEDEQKWYKREKRTLECRLQNQNEVKQALNLDLKALIREQNNEQQEVQQQIKNTDLFVQSILYEIFQLDEKIKLFQEKRRSAERIESFKKEILELNDEIDRYKAFKTEIEKENESRKADRKKDLEFAERQNKLFLSAISNREKYDSFIQQYRESLDKYAQEKATAILSESDYIRQNTVICPQCNLRFYKDSGCCEVTCPCGHDFCTICKEPWITHERGFYYCPNQETIKKVNYDDGNDVRFYPNPMNLQKKIEYYKWKYFHDMFLKHKAKYDGLYKKFLLTKDKAPAKGESFTDDLLSPFNKLVKQLEQENGQEGRSDALKLVSNLLFAQSIVSWGTAGLYFLGITEFTTEYIEMLKSLENKEDELTELLNDPADHQAQEFQDKLAELNEEIELVLKTKL